MIREAKNSDIAAMIALDRQSYGEFGETQRFFDEKLSAFPQGLVVVEEAGAITGFAIFEKLDKTGAPKNFSEPQLTNRKPSGWICAFTTKTNYKDVLSDSKLLDRVEEKIRKLGCEECLVPLTKEHPFEKNGVFTFWQKHGYRKEGEIIWNGKFECHLFRKRLER